jgi:branched-chain amino acid transport system substrate-binding protein
MGLAFTSLSVSATASSYTAQCLQLQQQKVDYAQLNFSSAAAAKLVSDCQAQGYNPTWGTSEQVVGKNLLAISNATFYGPASAFPSVLDIPAVKTFRDAMKQYAKDNNWAEGTGSYAWSGLEMLHKAISGITGQVTAASITAALNTIKDENLDGLLANKVTFTAGQPTQLQSHPCMFVVGIKNGKTVAPNGATPLCIGS